MTNPDAADLADPDGDGVPNALEYFAGTDPTKATSRLRLDSGGWRSGSDLAFQLLSAPGKLYVLESTPTLINPNWTPVITNLGDLKGKFIDVLQLVAAIKFLEKAVTAKDALDVLWYGIAVTLIIGVLLAVRVIKPTK